MEHNNFKLRTRQKFDTVILFQRNHTRDRALITMYLNLDSIYILISLNTYKCELYTDVFT